MVTVCCRPNSDDGQQVQQQEVSTTLPQAERQAKCITANVALWTENEGGKLDGLLFSSVTVGQRQTEYADNDNHVSTIPRKNTLS